METIKNYLETMFANMPNTDAVLRAKQELLTMMEDKYNELIADGKSENEAVGKVISEFGNLEELSEDLGIAEQVKGAADINKKTLSMDEIKGFLKSQSRHSLCIALGVFFCIIWLTPALMFSVADMEYSDVIAGVSMIGCVAIGVFFFVFSGLLNKRWDYIRNESCYVDISSVRWLKEQKEQCRATAAIQKTLGIVCCVLCMVPAIVFDEIEVNLDRSIVSLEDMGGALLFALVAIGVFLIVYSSIRLGSYDRLINLNDEETVSGNYKKEKRGKRDVCYNNPVVEAIMSVYWPTLASIYLIWSFLSFDWNVTWIVWVIGALLQVIIDAIFEEKGNEVA